MNDKRGARDWDTIDLQEAWQVQYWTTRFGVREVDLQEAVKTVGTAAKDVQHHFGVRGHGRWKVDEQTVNRNTPSPD
ncbi:MAG: DUF3606 domain-containing protein [Betaproteobacteria bacterium]